MAEVLVDFEIQLAGPDGRIYGARACGRARPDGLWEGWIEFDPTDGSAAVRTGRETTQPNRDDIYYWATGLTAAYLDGALLRTLKPLPTLSPRVSSRTTPAYPGPAESGHAHAPAVAGVNAVLDPFHVYTEGVDVLRRQLYALSEGQLGNIVKSYGLSTLPAEVIDRMHKDELVTTIVLAVEQRT